MLRGIKIGCWITVMFIMGGCAKSQEGVNHLIAEQNKATQMHMTTALANARTSEAVVAMSILFAVNAGQQKFYRDDTALDYFRAFTPWVSLLLPLAYTSHNNNDSRAMSAGRDIYINSSNQHDAWSSATQNLFTTDHSILYSTDVMEESGDSI